MYSDLYVYRSRKSGECRLFLLLGSLFIPFDVFHRFLFIIIQYIKIKWVYIYIYIFSISPYDDYSCNLNRFFIHLGEILFVVFMLIYFYFGYYLIYVKRITMDWEDYQPVCNLELICECPIRVWFVFLFSSMFCPIYGMNPLFLIISK